MIMAANYGDAVLLKSAVKVTYFIVVIKRMVSCHQPALSFEKPVTNFKSVDVKITQVKLAKCIDC